MLRRRSLSPKAAVLTKVDLSRLGQIPVVVGFNARVQKQQIQGLGLHQVIQILLVSTKK